MTSLIKRKCFFFYSNSKSYGFSSEKKSKSFSRGKCMGEENLHELFFLFSCSHVRNRFIEKLFPPLQLSTKYGKIAELGKIIFFSSVMNYIELISVMFNARKNGGSFHTVLNTVFMFVVI
jgi:hypothetical protein